jgi:two-component system chemotaxis response regulator CheY
MKILIAEDDLASRKFLQKFLSQYGECDVVLDGLEALDAYMLAMRENVPYSLVCLDIMMPKVDGVRALKAIRDFEKQKGISEKDRTKVVMTTALADTNFVRQAFDLGCEAYAAKPIDTAKLTEVIQKLGLGEDLETSGGKDYN